MSCLRMLSHNYDVAAQNAKSGISSSDSDMYKASLNDPEKRTYIWNGRSQSLNDILKEETLPLVVKLYSANSASKSETPVDLRRPFLLYKEVKGKKLHARNVKSKPAVREVGRTVYQAVGPEITFPDSFSGFFKVVDSKDQPLSGIGEVSRLMSKSFISIEPCVGYVCFIQLKESVYQKAELPPGLYRANSILEGNISYLTNRKKEKKKLLRCLACQDDKGKTVLFPMEATGKFYISEENAKFSRHINIDAACRVHKWIEYEPTKVKGLVVRMVHGQVPQQECQFTGLVEFLRVSEEHTVIACTMSQSPRLFEMAVTSEPYFIKAVNSHAIEGEPLQQRCVKFSKAESDAYLQAVKVKKEYDVDKVQS